MRTTDLETAIAEFLALGARLRASQPLTVQRVLDEMTAWYRDHRVEGAALDEDGDMLLVQWGASRLLVVSGPTDLRTLGDEDLVFADQEVKYLNVTRQVFATGEHGEAEFDDSAVQMSITIGFALADGNEPGANLWIHSPDDIDGGKKKLSSTPFVQSFLTVPALTVAITVGHYG